MVWYFVFLILVLCFGFVLLFGAPYLPTHKKQITTMLDLMELKKGQTLYELGCGDGQVMVEAAKRGIHSVGYEMNPLLAVAAYWRTWKYRKMVKIVCGNFWNADLKNADGVYVFLLDRFMEKLDKKLSLELRQGVKLASYTFKIPNKKIITSRKGMFIYKY